MYLYMSIYEIVVLDPAMYSERTSSPMTYGNPRVGGSFSVVLWMSFQCPWCLLVPFGDVGTGKRIERLARERIEGKTGELVGNRCKMMEDRQQIKEAE